MSIDTTSLAESMATTFDTLAGVNPLRKAEVTTQRDLDDAHRDDLLEFFERHAGHTDANDNIWIRVDAVVDLILDSQDLAALIQRESTRSATPRKEQ